MAAEKTFIAHISGNEIQTCNEHSVNTAKYASGGLKKVSLSETAYLAGLLHDCGKYTQEFSDYIFASSKGEEPSKRIIHSFAGVNYLLKRYHVDQNDWTGYLTAELVSYAIGSHHGLFDCIDEKHENGFTHRMDKQPDYEEEAIGNFHRFGPESEEKIDLHFEKAKNEIGEAVGKIVKIKQDNSTVCFYLGMLSRLITSSLIDADRRDTSEFMSGTDRILRLKADSELWKKCLNNLEKKLDSFPSESIIQKARREMSDYCCSFGEEPCGIYRLNIPTGGGKTLSSLRYALRHCEKYGKKRIFYVAPLISILEQNSKVISNAIGDASIVLEHHSNIVHDIDDDSENRLRYDLLAETWDSPIIVTTLVQLLDSMFSDSTSCVRRFHALCDSVLIIDEVQSVPDNMLTLFNLTLNFLSGICNTTVILCSATQPCLEKLKYRLDVSEKSIIPKDRHEEYHNIFRRTYFKKQECNINEIPFIIRGLLESVSNVLVVCNTKSESVSVFRNIRESEDFHDCNLFHLSASMCMKHRHVVLEKMYDALRRNERLVCVSTQVIEAGVDISFESVIRFSAGIENIIQSAGRCNRNGESDSLMPVVIAECPDEKLGNMKSISIRKVATEELLADFSRSADEYNGDLSSDKAVGFYYRKLYAAREKDFFDYPVKGKPSIYELLSENKSYSDNGQEAAEYHLRQAFKSAGMEFNVFDDGSETIIVPYDEEGREIIALLFGEKAKYDLVYVSKLIERSKKYCVSVYRNLLERLTAEGAIISACDGKLLILKDGWYDNDVGLVVLGDDGGSQWNTLIL